MNIQTVISTDPDQMSIFDILGEGNVGIQYDAHINAFNNRSLTEYERAIRLMELVISDFRGSVQRVDIERAFNKVRNG
jgi:hypothetical protein